MQLQDTSSWILLMRVKGTVKRGSSHTFLNSTKLLMIRLKSSWSLLWNKAKSHWAYGWLSCRDSAWFTAQGKPAGYAPGKVAAAYCWSLPFNLTTNNFRRKPSLPWSRTTDSYQAKKHWKARMKVWDLLEMPNDQVMRMPGQATKTTLVSVQALWIQNAHSNRGMITAQPWHCWHRYKKAQPWVLEFVLSIAETIPNIRQNFRTQHIICMCPVLTSLVPHPLRKDATLTHNWKRTCFAKNFVKRLLGENGRQNII